MRSVVVSRQEDQGQVTMGAVHRPAMREDASRLYDIRRRSILELAPPTMSKAEAQAWASQLTLSGMERKLRELEVWVAELDGAVAGWGAVRGDCLESLYTAPEFAGQGVGAGLLGMLEGLLRAREFPSVCLEASPNARSFYLRRGYRAAGPQTVKGAWPMVKEHLA
jgi:GNAT superfamily N-acetyltransferase